MLIYIIVNNKSDIFLQNEPYSFNFFSKIEKKLDWDSNYDDFLHEKVEVELVPHIFIEKAKVEQVPPVLLFLKSRSGTCSSICKKTCFQTTFR